MAGDLGGDDFEVHVPRPRPVVARGGADDVAAVEGRGMGGQPAGGHEVLDEFAEPGGGDDRF